MLTLEELKMEEKQKKSPQKTQETKHEEPKAESNRQTSQHEHSHLVPPTQQANHNHNHHPPHHQQQRSLHVLEGSLAHIHSKRNIDDSYEATPRSKLEVHPAKEKEASNDSDEEEKEESKKKADEEPVFISLKCGAKFTTLLDGKSFMQLKLLSEFAKTDQGQLWSLGNGLHCQLGTGEPIFQVKTPQKIPRMYGMKIAKYACGENYAVAFTDEGNLYGWGDANYGKLGNYLLSCMILILSKKASKNISMHPYPLMIPNQMFNTLDNNHTSDIEARFRKKIALHETKKGRMAKVGPHWVDLACGADHTFFVKYQPKYRKYISNSLFR